MVHGSWFSSWFIVLFLVLFMVLFLVVAHKILVSGLVPLGLIGPLNWVGAGPRGFGDEGVWDLSLTTVNQLNNSPHLVHVTRGNGDKLPTVQNGPESKTTNYTA